MTYDEIKNLLVENFCKGGTYDNSGRWRYSSEGNTVYLADKKGGWAYVCKKIENNGYMYIVKYSIKGDGGMKIAENIVNHCIRILKKCFIKLLNMLFKSHGLR